MPTVTLGQPQFEKYSVFPFSVSFVKHFFEKEESFIQLRNWIPVPRHGAHEKSNFEERFCSVHSQNFSKFCIALRYITFPPVNEEFCVTRIKGSCSYNTSKSINFLAELWWFEVIHWFDNRSRSFDFLHAAYRRTSLSFSYLCFPAFCTCAFLQELRIYGHWNSKRDFVQRMLKVCAPETDLFLFDNIWVNKSLNSVGVVFKIASQQSWKPYRIFQKNVPQVKRFRHFVIAINHFNLSIFIS